MRLFIAILLSDKARSQLCILQDALRANAVKGRFSRKENLHLTLAFLGELPSSSLDAIKHCMDKASIDIGTPFTLSFTGLDYFRQREGNLYYAGFSFPPALKKLRSQLIQALSEAHLPYDSKPFRPHLTLGRSILLQDGFSPSCVSFRVSDLTVSSIALMESKRIHGMLVYKPLYRTYFLDASKSDFDRGK